MEKKHSSRGKSSSLIMVTVGIVLMLLALIAIIAYFLNGQTTVEGENTGIVRNKATLTCESTNLEYPYFRYDNSIKKSATIDASFGEKSIQSIAIKFTLTYNSKSEAQTSETQNRASLGVKLGDDGLSADDLAMGYSVQGNNMNISLYANSSVYDSKTSKYFLAGDISVKASVDDFAENYQKQGFKCTKTE